MKGKIVLITSILFLWGLIAQLNIFPPLILPAPLDVLKSLGADFLTGELPKGIAFSFLVIIGASVPSLVLAFLLAWFSHLSPSFDRMAGGISALVHPLPGIALLPILILWTGLGIHIIALIVIHSVLWPYYINIRSGFKQVPALWLDLADNNRISGTDRFFHILLPASFPQVFAGLKIGWARAWRAVISAEMIFGTIGNSGGLGWFIYNKRLFMDTPGMFGGVILLMIIGLTVEHFIFDRIEEGIGRVYAES